MTNVKYSDYDIFTPIRVKLKDDESVAFYLNNGITPIIHKSNNPKELVSSYIKACNQKKRIFDLKEEETSLDILSKD